MKKIFVAILAITAVAGVLYAQVRTLTPEQKLMYSHAIIDQFYVEEVNNDTLVQEAIVAMLKTLDPHSAYTSPKETEEFNMPLQGKFSGIGVQFNLLRDTIYVVQTIPGGPSEKVGIRPGDRIIYSNDTLLAGQKFKNNDVLTRLRGPKGTIANLKVKRGDSPELIEFRVVRDDIPFNSVDASYMATPTTGYIRISRFAESTHKEVVEALKKLKKQGMQNLIVDLEDNGGGYLGAAFDLSSEFLPKGSEVVYTAGRVSEPQHFATDRNGMMIDGRLVVMVNQYSASAAEILSGAVQDNDRGVIVGRRTFGKGLVQRPFPFPDGSMIRLTTARYYTPSGRCIQKPYEKGQTEEYYLDMYNRFKSGELWSADSIHYDPSLKYKTLKRGRTVYGGGGIMPDLFVSVDTAYYTPYYRDIVAKGVLNRTVLDYIDHHRQDLRETYPTNVDFVREFKVDEALMQQLVDAAEKEKIEPNAEQLATSRPMIEAIIKGLLARDLYEDGSYFESVNILNPVYLRALEVAEDPTLYEQLLTPTDK